MNKSDLRIIKGGLSEEAKKQQKIIASKFRFSKGWVLDTRLMGVVCIYLCSTAVYNNALHEKHQFFYFDASEYGIDRFEEVIDPSFLELERTENSFIGGLGGSKIPMEKKELLILLINYANFNLKHNIIFPDKCKAAISDLLEIKQSKFNQTIAEKYLDFYSKKELEEVLFKTCTEITCPEEAVHYTIMRLLDHDATGANILLKNKNSTSFIKENFGNLPMETLYKNVIHWDNGKRSGTCDTYAGHENYYEKYTFSFALSKTRLDCKLPKPTFTISSLEIISKTLYTPLTALIELSHSEYITTAYYDAPPENFDIGTSELLNRAMSVPDNNGVSFMIYNENNDHVKKTTYLLHNDMVGLFYMSNLGQLIIVSFTNKAQLMMYQDLITSPHYKYINQVERYHFHEPIMSAFINSGFDDFNDFLAEIIPADN